MSAASVLGPGTNDGYRGARPTPVPEPAEPVTPDSPQPDPEPMPTYEDPPPVKPVA